VQVSGVCERGEVSEEVAQDAVLGAGLPEACLVAALSDDGCESGVQFFA